MNSTLVRLDVPAPCRVCALDDFVRAERRLSSLADATGPIHLCCARLSDGASSCTSCRAGESAERDWETRGKRRSVARAKQAALIEKARLAAP